MTVGVWLLSRSGGQGARLGGAAEASRWLDGARSRNGTSLTAADMERPRGLLCGLGWAFSSFEAALLGLGMFEGRCEIEFRSLRVCGPWGHQVAAAGGSVRQPRCGPQPGRSSGRPQVPTRPSGSTPGTCPGDTGRTLTLKRVYERSRRWPRCPPGEWIRWGAPTLGRSAEHR